MKENVGINVKVLKFHFLRALCLRIFETSESNRGERLFLYLIVTVLSIMCAEGSWAMEMTSHGCQEERQFSGADYWFWEGYLGISNVQKSDGELKGRLVSDPDICFRVSVAETEAPLSRTRGYKEAILEFLKRLSRASQTWNSDTQTLAIRHKIKVLTGQSFPSYTVLSQWWKENNDYLVWSEDKKHLLIDNKAKAEGSPIAPLNPTQQLASTTYWFYEGMGWLTEVSDEGSHLVGKAWTGEHEVKFRVLKAKLTDRLSKQEGYRQAVELIVNDRLLIPQLGEESLELIEHLQKMTEEKFRDKQLWIRWWNTNRESLVLAEDGQRLVVKPLSKGKGLQ